MSEFLTTNDAAKVLGKAPATILYYEKVGRLTPKRTQGGIRLFPRDQVERLASEQQRLKMAEARAYAKEPDCGTAMREQP